MSEKPDTPEQNREEYLGDGLYVSFDGWGVRLRAPREGGDHFVVIDPEIWLALRQWVNRWRGVKRHLEGQQ
jgi:hypothetical protein